MCDCTCSTMLVLERYWQRFIEVAARSQESEKAAWIGGAAAACASYSTIALTPAGEDRCSRLKIALETTSWDDRRSP